MTPEQAIGREVRVQALPELNPRLGWAVEGWIWCALASHRPGRRFAPKGFVIVAYAVARRNRKDERGRMHLRRYWSQPVTWDRRTRPPEGAVLLRSIEAGSPSTRVKETS